MCYLRVKKSPFALKKLFLVKTSYYSGHEPPSLLEGGGVRNFYFGVGGYIVRGRGHFFGGVSRNFEVKIKTA